MRSHKDPMEKEENENKEVISEVDDSSSLSEKPVKVTKRTKTTRVPRKKTTRSKVAEEENVEQTPPPDKIEEDYESRHQGDSIWGQRDQIYESFRKDHTDLPEAVSLEEQLEETEIPRRKVRKTTRTPLRRSTKKTSVENVEENPPIQEESEVPVMSSLYGPMSEEDPQSFLEETINPEFSVDEPVENKENTTEDTEKKTYTNTSNRPNNSNGQGNNYRNPRRNLRYNNNNNNNRRQEWNRPNMDNRDNNRDNTNQGVNYRYRHYSRESYPEPISGARGRHGEPISLAEELAMERQFVARSKTPEVEETTVPMPIDKKKETFISDLQKMTMQELVTEARNENMELISDEPRNELVFRILKERIRKNGLMFGEGTLEILPDEFGFLRSSQFHYLSCPDDIYISPSQIRRFGLRNGLTISGQIRPPKEKERYFALLRIEAINQEDPNMLASRPNFDDLTAIHPDQRIILETNDGDINTRVLDLIVPVGFGQRGLIVSPPRAGKTILMQKMARAVLKNYPDSYVFMLLIDERPEEVTDMEREVKGTHCEVVSSTFDEPPARHIQVSEMVLEKAKRMVEYGKDVVIFLDSITRLARAWNTECPDSGKTLTGGVDSNALQRPKKFFGSARKVEEGGSLTIIATALIGTGSRMDDVIFEEFKGTGNLEIRLDRSLVDRRIWPAIDITQSGTRREEMILDPEEHVCMAVLRRLLCDMSPVDAMEYLTEKLAKTQKNIEFLIGLKHE